MKRGREVVCDTWLQNITASAAPERLADVLFRVEHAEEHNGHPGASPIEGVFRLIAVKTWHVDIEHNEVWLELTGECNGFTPVGRDADHVELAGQDRGERVEHTSMVVDEKNSELCAAGRAVHRR